MPNETLLVVPCPPKGSNLGSRLGSARAPSGPVRFFLGQLDSSSRADDALLLEQDIYLGISAALSIGGGRADSKYRI